ncbi:MAG: alpha/beta fold hydrolase [Candidatus Nanopelagicales bacterium]
METYPRQAALTGQFRHGQPRSFRATATSVYFLRSAGPRDAALRLHRWDRGTGTTQEVLSGAGRPTETELALRERLRETAGGITAFDVREDRVVAGAGGRVLAWDARNGARTIEAAHGAFDARLSPDAAWISWVAEGALHVCAWDGSQHRVVVGSDEDDTWAVCDFIAAEELGRTRGYWWLPDSSGLLVQRTDETDVPVWYRTDAAHPDRAPVAQRYPHAGAPNATVELWRFTPDGEGQRVPLPAAEYLATVGGGLIGVLDREQTALGICDLSGQPVGEIVGRPWLDLVPGLPRTTGDDLLAWTDEARRRLTIGGRPVTPPEVQLRSYLGAIDGAHYVTACSTPAESRVARVDSEGFRWLSEPDTYTTAVVEAGLLITSTARWDRYGTQATIRDGQYTELAVVENLAEQPAVAAEPVRLAGGEEDVQTVVLLPGTGTDEPLPVLMYPYAGPHAQRVLASRSAYAGAQWLADQGFCVIVADGRGTPGQSPAWEHAVHRDLRDPALADQVMALERAATALPGRLDTSRVGILGWSYGGYLAALAVLERPDVFHAAVAGAPVTEWRLYDTAYTERYLGNPAADAAPYDHCSLLPLAPGLQRPLLLIHGLADDNVFAAHTLQLSSALLAAGRSHEVLPLSGVTHMTPQPEVAENLLLMQVDFFRRHLG